MSNETTVETTPTAALTVVENPKQLVEVATKNQLEPVTAEQLFTAYRPFFTEVNRLLEDAKRVNVTDATQVTMIHHARELRIKLQKQRTGAEKVKDALKAESSRRGNAIQGMFNVIKFLTEPVEEKLLAAEKFAERAEAERIQKLETERKNLLRPFAPTVDLVSGYGTMEEADFQKMFAGLKLAHEQGEAAKKKESEDRAAKEKAEADERERVRQENEKLKREAAELAQARLKEQEEADRARYVRLETHKARVALLVFEELVTKEEAAQVTPGWLGELSDESFASYMMGLIERKRLAQERKEADERAAKERAEHDRKMKEAQEKTDREIAEIRRQNEEKAAAEQKKRDEAAAKERVEHIRNMKEAQEKLDAKLAEMSRKAKADADAKKKLEDEAEARRLADLKRRVEEDERKAAEEERQRIARNSPFVEKLRAFSLLIRGLETPDDPANRFLAKKIKEQLGRFCDYIDKEADTLIAAKNPTLPL